MKNIRGFTLIEVVIAAFILVVAVLAVLGLQLSSVKSSAKARELREAAAIAENVLQEVRSASADDISTACQSSSVVDGYSVTCQVTPCSLTADDVSCSAAVTDPQLYDVSVEIRKDENLLASSHTYVKPTHRLGDANDD